MTTKLVIITIIITITTLSQNPLIPLDSAAR
jgi:hypothetical protein